MYVSMFCKLELIKNVCKYKFSKDLFVFKSFIYTFEETNKTVFTEEGKLK
jgi:hypothetical protein